jgi:hypothetical protein
VIDCKLDLEVFPSTQEGESMPSSFTDASFIVSFVSLLIAFWATHIARQDLKANNQSFLKIRKLQVSYLQKMSVEKGKMFSELEFEIENKGVPLYRPRFFLCFNEDLHRSKIAMEHQLPNAEDGKMERCMIARIAIQSYDHFSQRAATGIIDLKKQNATIVVESQGFECAEIPLFFRFQKARALWNKGSDFWAIAVENTKRTIRKKSQGPANDPPAKLVPPGTGWGLRRLEDYQWKFDEFRKFCERSNNGFTERPRLPQDTSSRQAE